MIAEKRTKTYLMLSPLVLSKDCCDHISSALYRTGKEKTPFWFIIIVITKFNSENFSRSNLCHHRVHFRRNFARISPEITIRTQLQKSPRRKSNVERPRSDFVCLSGKGSSIYDVTQFWTISTPHFHAFYYTEHFSTIRSL